MDINDLRSVLTVLAFTSFLGIVWWAWRRRSQKEFAVAEQPPFADTIVGPHGAETGNLR